MHWAHGAFGYFPSYALGAVIAAQLFETLRAATPDLDEHIASGQFATVTDWLAEHVHAEGARLTPQELVQQVTGKGLSAAVALRYLEARTWRRRAVSACAASQHAAAGACPRPSASWPRICAAWSARPSRITR